MKTKRLVNLLLKSSDNNPYGKKISEKENLISAIELAKLFKEFADSGRTNEAMNIESPQWEEAIGALEDRLADIK